MVKMMLKTVVVDYYIALIEMTLRVDSSLGISTDDKLA